MTHLRRGGSGLMVFTLFEVTLYVYRVYMIIQNVLTVAVWSLCPLLLVRQFVHPSVSSAIAFQPTTTNLNKKAALLILDFDDFPTLKF